MTFAMLILLFFLQNQGISGLKYQTISFVTMVCFQLFNALNSRSFSESFYSRLLRNKVLVYSIVGSFAVLSLFVYVPTLSEFMKIEMIRPFEFLLCILYSSSILVVEEIRKRFKLFIS
jgi:magnesium-transporting ATPase (P-type)